MWKHIIDDKAKSDAVIVALAAPVDAKQRHRKVYVDSTYGTYVHMSGTRLNLSDVRGAYRYITGEGILPKFPPSPSSKTKAAWVKVLQRK